MRNDSMTVRAADGALGNFSLGLFNALRAADVHRLGAAIKMVKVKCAWIIESAINAASFRFVVADPFANALGSCLGRGIYMLSVAGLLQPVFSPLFSLFWRRLLSLWARSALAKSRTILGGSLGLELSQTMSACVKQWRGVIVGFHVFIVSRPCKPDIFEATYEPAGSDGQQ